MTTDGPGYCKHLLPTNIYTLTIKLSLSIFLGTWFTGFIPLCLYNIVFGLLDICGVPSFLRRYKVQPHRNVPVS